MSHTRSTGSVTSYSTFSIHTYMVDLEMALEANSPQSNTGSAYEHLGNGLEL